MIAADTAVYLPPPLSGWRVFRVRDKYIASFPKGLQKDQRREKKFGFVMQASLPAWIEKWSNIFSLLNKVPTSRFFLHGPIIYSCAEKDRMMETRVKDEENHAMNETVFKSICDHKNIYDEHE